MSLCLFLFFLLLYLCSFYFITFLTDSQPLPILNASSKTEEEKENENMPLSSATSNSKLNTIDENKTIYSDSLNEVKVRSPRSRAAVIISLPMEAIDFDEPIIQNPNSVKSDTFPLQNSLAFNNSTYVSNNFNNNLNIASNNQDTQKGICFS